MKKRNKMGFAALICMAILFLNGCAMTVEQMYCLPRRSERYDNLQIVMDEAMDSLQYSAPVAGENQQIVQMADLSGDGNSEIILFAKGGEEMPLKILIFAPVDDGYQHVTTLESAGTGFNQVEYVQMDGKPGLELVVGRQVSDQVLGNVSVYRYNEGTPELLLNTNYVKFLTTDLEGDGRSDLFVIRSGMESGDRGLACLFTVQEGIVERSAEVEMSVPGENLKRIITGTLQSGQRAVFVASAAGEDVIITDVFALVNGNFENVSYASGAGGVNTLRNYYVYADDIDKDGVVELPELITLKTPADEASTASQHMIRWYSLTSEGLQVEKMYTYHNYLEGWYLELDARSASRIFLLRDEAGGYQFHLWEDREDRDLLFTIYRMTGEARMSVVQQEDMQEVYKTDNVVYAVKLAEAAEEYGITIDVIMDRFHLIQTDWNSGEM